MKLSKKLFNAYVREFRFRDLFIDMGWNQDRSSALRMVVDERTFMLNAAAEKNGFKVLVCSTDEDASVARYTMRLKIEKKVAILFQEHLIIFVNQARTEQIWQLAVRRPGQPNRITETRYAINQDPQLLYQRASGLIFELNEEEHITIVDVTQRVSKNFGQNAEKVTKNFYERFTNEHHHFYQFVKGISDHIDDWNARKGKDQKYQENRSKQWYVSLMLNRLMFCYFIQKKGFLNNDKNYLRNKLDECKSKKGKDEFYSFYRNFLLVLFHEGLDEPDQKQHFKVAIGKVPYLNGGLFGQHEVEADHHIEIDDRAFEKIFDFFDRFEWHLDTSKNASGRDINPDVIGYIFEQYINDRAKMGAYYTKEDITGYIGRNTIVPWLLKKTAAEYPVYFAKEASCWKALAQSGDLYIPNSLKYGIAIDLPDDISIGVHDTQQRNNWNKPAPAELGLPTETWRDVAARRSQYQEIFAKILKGEINDWNLFVNYNLDIQQFVHDLLENSTDPEFLEIFYRQLNSVSIIDPTCGSGAFLFAALNILEPLYEACLQRMKIFTDENPVGTFPYFDQVLHYIDSPQHPNRQYFIYKNIILHNLYGVDIMREAVEIAKLRLFLKLVATVDADYKKPNLGLEPLPDVDFNIRAGNTLVGFATKKELELGGGYTFDFDKVMPEVEKQCDLVAASFDRYKEIQLTRDNDYENFKRSKALLNRELAALNHKLNKLQHKQVEGIPYEDWMEGYIPFHWFAEFYEIINERKGFDIVIGNPPYVAIKDVAYVPKNYQTLDCGDLYALCVERSVKSLLNPEGNIGMIIPISITSTDGYLSLRKVCSQRDKNYYFSNFGVRPSKLFDGVDKRLTIFIANSADNGASYSTKYYRWVSGERPVLFDKLSYQRVVPNEFAINGFAKISSATELSIIAALKKQKRNLGSFSVKTSAHKVRYTRKLQYFIQFFEQAPRIYNVQDELQPPSELKEICFNDAKQKNIALAALNSSLFFWFFITFSDCRNVNTREIVKFPIDLDSFDRESSDELERLGKVLMGDLQQNAIFQSRNDKRAGQLRIESFQPRLSKNIIDEIDQVLARYYQFSPAQTDFVLNYDIKYRMGREESEDEPIQQPILTETHMKEFSLDEGIYSVSDVHRYTNLNPQKIRRWFRELSAQSYEGLSFADQSNVDQYRISFHGLVELVVMSTLRDNGFLPNKILKARADLKAKTGKLYPFATNNVKNDLKPIKDERKPSNSILTFIFDSGNITLDGSGQYNLAFIEEFFDHIEFDTEGIAQRIFPVKDSKLIIIDPKQGGGKALINGKGVEAQVISMMYSGKDSLSLIKRQYEVTEEEIMTAVHYWN